jgi:homoserine O-acetyltransferase
MDRFDLRGKDGTLQSRLSTLATPTLVMGVDSDLLMPLEEQEEIAVAIAGKHPNNAYVVVHSAYAHDAFLIQTEPFSAQLRTFLAATA